MRYYVDHGVLRASNLEMERRLLSVVRDEICDCVISDAALINFVRDLKDKQDKISRENPRLRRVEISADLSSSASSIARVGRLRIGQLSIVLHPVKSIIEL